MEFYFLLSHILNLYFFLFFLLLLNNIDCKIFKKQRPALDGYRYRRANKSKVILRYCKNNYAGRVRFDRVECVKVRDHAHAPNSEEIISVEFK